MVQARVRFKESSGGSVTQCRSGVRFRKVARQVPGCKVPGAGRCQVQGRGSGGRPG